MNVKLYLLPSAMCICNLISLLLMAFHNVPKLNTILLIQLTSSLKLHGLLAGATLSPSA